MNDIASSHRTARSHGWRGGKHHRFDDGLCVDAMSFMKGIGDSSWNSHVRRVLAPASPGARGYLVAPFACLKRTLLQGRARFAWHRAGWPSVSERLRRSSSDAPTQNAYKPRGVIMRCLFAHKWVTSWEKTFVRSIVPYRKCRRCGVVQRGIFDSLTRDVSWETLRERNYMKAQQIRVARQPASWLHQLAHTLGVRRSRIGDRTGSRGAPRWIEVNRCSAVLCYRARRGNFLRVAIDERALLWAPVFRLHHPLA